MSMSNPWSPEQATRLRELRAQGNAFAVIAERLGRTEWAVRAKFEQLTMTPQQKLDYSNRRRKRERRERQDIGPYVDFGPKAAFDHAAAARLLDERDRRSMAPIRDTTAYLCGDPRVGYSALESRG